MPSAKELRDELRSLRKESMKPVSRMKKADCEAELERLRGKREETPPVASVGGAVPKKEKGKIADVKVAKEQGFPVAPTDEKKKSGKKSSGMASKTASAEVSASSSKKPSKMERLMKMLEEMSDSE